MTTSRSRVGRSVIAGLLTIPLTLGFAVAADAKPKRPGGGGGSTVAQILDIYCSGSAAKGLSYTMSSSSSTVDVEVRWRLASATVLSFGSTYAVYTYRGVPSGTVLSAPAPSNYTVTSASVVPIAKNGRASGTADSEAVSCSTG